MKHSVLLSSLLLPLALVAAAPNANKKIDYNGYKLIRVPLAKNAAGLEQKIAALGVHTLNPGTKEHLDIVISPDNIKTLETIASGTAVLNEDVGAALAEEGEFGTYAVPSASWFTAYHAYADHVKFLQDLAGSFPSNAEIITAGASYQGKPITGIHIWGSGGKDSKPAILFHGGVHAREWIASKTTQFQAYQLLTKYSTDSGVKALVDKFDFYIFPIVNPDGFSYSQTNDRLWRKNRQPVSGNSCIGRDINRNWPFKWELTNGASTNPCSETYKGVAAGDSPENQGLAAYVNKLRDLKGIRLYIDFHSYGQYVLSPWGYDCNAVPSNNAALQSAAKAVATAIAGVSGTRYTTGPSCSTLYATTGSGPDHVYSVGKAPYAYTIELRDTGSYGFTLPANQIQPTATETWAGVLKLLNTV